MLKDIRVAAIQAKVPKTTREGEEQVTRLVGAAVTKPVDLVGLPEDCVAQYSDVRNGYKALEFLSELAKTNKVWLFGATAVLENNKLYNRGFLLNREGVLVAKHDKIVLTPTEEGVTPGDTLRVFDTEFGKIALLVCKDAFHRYSAWFFDKLRKSGADVVLVPSYSLNVSKRSVELWADSLKANSKWFDVYVVAPGTIGENSTKYSSFGHALIVCPNRVVLAEGSYDKEEILRATLDIKSLEEIRSTYGSLWQPKEVPITK